MPITAKQIERRKGYIGASDIAPLFNLPNEDGSPGWSCAADIWASKVFDIAPESEELDGSPAEIGNALESNILDYAFRRITANPNKEFAEWLEGEGVTVDNLIHVKNQFRVFGRIGANLDDQVAIRGSGGHWRGTPFAIECKTTGKWDEWGDEGTDQVPDRVYLQCQAQCRAAALLGVFVAVLLPGFGRLEIRIYYVPASPKIMLKIVKKVDSFWRDYVKTKKPPPGEGSVRPSSVFRRIVREAGKTATIPADIIQAYVHAAAEETGAKKAKTAAQNEVYSYLGDAEVGVPDDPSACGFEVTYKEQERAEYIVAAAKFRVLRKRKIK